MFKVHKFLISDNCYYIWISKHFMFKVHEKDIGTGRMVKEVFQNISCLKFIDLINLGDVLTNKISKHFMFKVHKTKIGIY